MSLRIPRWMLASLAAAACWPAAPAALAQSPVDEIVVRGTSTDGEAIRHQTVYYADLNLRRDAGARALLLRIRAAAKNVCEPYPSIHDLQEQTPYRVCLYDAAWGAVRRVDNHRVEDLFDDGR